MLPLVKIGPVFLAVIIAIAGGSTDKWHENVRPKIVYDYLSPGNESKTCIFLKLRLAQFMA